MHFYEAKKNLKKFPLKILFFTLFLAIMPGICKFLDLQCSKVELLNFLHVVDLLLVSFGAYIFLNKQKQILSSTFGLILLYIVLMRLSLIFSLGENHHRAFYEFSKSVLAISIFFLFSTKYFQENKKYIVKYFFVLFLSFAFFESILAIMQFIFQKPVGFSLLKEPIFGDGIFGSASISMSNKSFFTSFINNQTGYFIRAHGTFIHPNVLGGFLNISLLMSLYLIYKSNKKFLFSLFLFIQLLALILTFSRAAFGSFILSTFLFFILMIYKKYKVKKMVFIFSAFLLLAISIFSKQFIERGFLGKIFQSKKAIEANIGSSNTRKNLQDVSINIIKKRPFLGIGYRNFIIKRNDYTTLKKIDRANVHNIYLLIASETGLISLVVFLLFIGVIFKNTFFKSLNPLTICFLCCAVSFLIIGFLDHYPISSQFGRIILFMFLGFLNQTNKPLSYSQKAFLYQ